MEQLKYHGADFCEILYWEVLLKSEQQIQFWLKVCVWGGTCYMPTYVHSWPLGW